jgi:hypothetical protein
VLSDLDGFRDCLALAADMFRERERVRR